MTSCLGIYVDKFFIKYAKLQKNKENIKIVTFDTIIYENLENAIIKIITETNSYKIPISINLTEELYKQFYIKTNTTKNDIKKLIEENLKDICKREKCENFLIDSRYIITKDQKRENYSILLVAAKQLDVKEKKQLLSKFHLQSIVPISTSITNLANFKNDENMTIINIEDKTKITTVIEGQIYRVDILKEGINFKEQSEKYIEKIMKTLYKIVIKTKKIIDGLDITKVYITGNIININNVETYFQEYLLDVKCEILKPFFLETTSIKTSEKEYIDVNPAIALALNGLGYNKKELNFQKKVSQNIEAIFQKQDLKNNKQEKNKPKRITVKEKLMLRVCAVFVFFIVSFLGFSNSASKILTEREEAISRISNEILNQYALMDEDLNKINKEIEEYNRIIENINSLTEVEKNSNSERIINKNSIPNMLGKITRLIPKKVKIISITNAIDSKQIIIEAESEKYEQLGYFSSILKTENVLKNIKSTSGSKEGSVVRVTIEGELP